MAKRKDNDPEKDIDACDHVHMDDTITEDEDLPETNLVPGLDKPKAKTSTESKQRRRETT